MSSSTSKSSTSTRADTPFLSRHGQKIVAITFWLLFLGAYWYYVEANDLTVADSVENLADLLTQSAFGPILYIIIYWLRPLIFFPASILTVLSGFLFGPIGIIYTIIGANGSAMVAYLVGYFFGKGVLKEQEDSAGFIQKYTTRMRENSFETVLLMRLIFLPYDLVNYSAGFLRIKWLPFLVATAVGSVPGTISFVLLGASFGTLDELLAGELKVNPPVLVSSIVLILASIGFSRLLKRREAAKHNA